MFIYRKKGMTLVETVVYVAIMVVVLLVIFSSIIFAMDVLKEINASKKIKSSAIFSLDRIIRQTRNADSINAVSSVFDVNPSKLVLSSTDESGSVVVHEFYLEDGIIKVDTDNVFSGNLTDPNASTTSFVVSRITNSASEGVKVQITIEDTQQDRSETFYSFVVPRGSY